MKKEIKTIDTISKFNQERIKEWLELTKVFHTPEHPTCPKCGEDMTYCNCAPFLAQDIMESLFYRKIELSPLEMKYKRMVKVNKNDG